MKYLTIYTLVVIGACGSLATSNTAKLAITNPGDYIIQGESFVNTDDLWYGINIERATKKAFYFLNNSITSKNGEGYMLQAGDEGIGVTNNNLDGSIITGNKFTWTGTDMKAITHGIFMGYNINNLVKYNYLKGVPYGILPKSSGMTNTSGGIAYNITLDAMIGANAKGISGVRFFNNTFYSSRTMEESLWKGQIQIYANNDAGSPGFASTNCKVFNNIFYTKYQIYNIVIDQSCLLGFESDYNIFYCEAGTPVFSISGVQKTFAQWQALGYDTHSVVVNPNFIGNTFIPSVPLYKGKDLGDEWKQGLSPSAEWGTSAPAVANQDSSVWQCGAYIVSQAPVADYYVAPYGSDNNAGTISAPFFSLNKVWSKIKAGNLVYLRGGTYAFNTQQVLKLKKGTVNAMIKIWAYPEETPIISKGSSYTAQFGVDFQGDYFHFKGLDISGYTQKTSGNLSMGMLSTDSSHNIYEQLDYHNNGCGFYIKGNSTDNLVLNSDFHHNQDPYTSGDPYGNADGLAIGYLTATTATNIIRGCRFWWNTDDGIDLWNNDGTVVIDSCWAWYNGYMPGSKTIFSGDGNGYKLGVTSADYTTEIKRKITNCLAWYNRAGGIVQNGAKCRTEVYNNTVWHNVTDPDNHLHGINLGEYNENNILKNNIAFANQYPSNLQIQEGANSTHNNNTWDIPFTMTSSDFVSIDFSGAAGDRQADGSLPVLDFLKLSPTSKLINAGVDVGLPFNGSAPDLGAFESVPVTSSSTLEIQNGDFRVYPNPFNDIINVSSISGDVKDLSLKLFDIRGIELYRTIESGDCKLDLSGYRPGIYFLQIICRSKTIISKLVKC